MARSRKAEAVETQEPEAVGPSIDAAVQHVQDSMGAEIVNEPSAFDGQEQVQEPGEVSQPPAEQAEAKKPEKKPFQVVRGWTSRNKQPVQYRKLTDADLGVILFKFVLPKDADDKERMPADIKDIIDAHKRYPETGDPTGLHFENSNKHGKVWVIRNDPEGRAIADKIDYALQKLAAKHELQEEQAAAR